MTEEGTTEKAFQSGRGKRLGESRTWEGHDFSRANIQLEQLAL